MHRSCCICPVSRRMLQREGLPGRRGEPRPQTLQCVEQSAGIVGRQRGDDVEIGREGGRPVGDACHAADDDELEPCVEQAPEDLGRVLHR